MKSTKELRRECLKVESATLNHLEAEARKALQDGKTYFDFCSQPLTQKEMEYARELGYKLNWIPAAYIYKVEV